MSQNHGHPGGQTTQSPASPLVDLQHTEHNVTSTQVSNACAVFERNGKSVLIRIMGFGASGEEETALCKPNEDGTASLQAIYRIMAAPPINGVPVAVQVAEQEADSEPEWMYASDVLEQRAAQGVS